jgi:mono/diheme cytochrome c family protein
MRALLKWTFRLVLVLVVAIIGFIGYVYYASNQAMAKTYVVTNVPTIVVPSDAASIARGKYLVEHVSMCSECHDKDLGGKIAIQNAAFGQFVSANLTRGRGGIGVGSSFTDQDFVRAILHGVKPDGRSLVFMPSGDFKFTAEDLGAIIAYVKSVPPVDRELPPTSVGPMARALGLFTDFPLTPAAKIDHERVTFLTASNPSDPVASGNSLVATAGCRSCHGPELIGGGGPPPGAANITPVGIGTWTEKDFFTALREHKRPNGTSIEEAMPRGYGQMSDEDLRKIFAYLKTVPPKGEKSKNQQKASM